MSNKRIADRFDAESERGDDPEGVDGPEIGKALSFSTEKARQDWAVGTEQRPCAPPVRIENLLKEEDEPPRGHVNVPRHLLLLLG